MPMSFRIVEEGGFVRVTFCDVLTSQDIVELVAAVDAIESGRDPVPHRLADLRDVTEVQIRFPDMHALANARRGKQFPNPFKSAVVVGNPVQGGMARMFRTLNDNPQIAVEVFEDEAAALAWLRA
jgi:stage II sporulation SpoAA-like protein